MTRRMQERLVGLLMPLMLILILGACSNNEGAADGDDDGLECTPACAGGLECVNGDCICAAANCCITNADCDAGEICNDTSNRCELIGTDDCDPACETGLTCLNGSCTCTEDNCCQTDEACGDTEYCNLAIHRCDVLPDGDTPDGDTPDGDPDDDGDLDSDDDGDSDSDSADGDTPDGDQTDGDEEPLGCMWGPEKLLQMENLPYYENLATTRQYSSRSQREDNQDTSTWRLFLEGGDNVLMHSKVPGCIYRIWLGNPDNIGGLRMKIYLNGESTPMVNSLVTEFFGYGTETLGPFISPLVGKVSESYYSYVPICWTDEIKVAVSGTPEGWQISYQELPECPELENFSLDMDVSELVDFYDNRLGEDPKPTEGNILYEASPSISAGASITIFEDIITDGVGKSINAFKLDIAAVNDDILNNAWLEIYWDGKDEMSEADVEVPLGMFFGSGYGEIDWSGLMMGMSTTGSYYSYWPMPYWESAKIKIYNRSQTDIPEAKIQILYGKNDYPRSQTGNFRAKYNEAIPTTDGLDYKALDLVGKGRIVGIIMALADRTESIFDNSYLNGDERFFIDGMSFPLYRGTGTDNFFNGNKLFRRDPYEKALFSLWKDSQHHYTARRMFIGDSIPFNSSVRMGFEHGGENDDNGNYRSVVYYYSTCLEGMQLSDEVCIGTITGVPCSETDHSFDIDKEYNNEQHKNVEGSYEGPYAAVTSIDSGRGVYSDGYMVMKVNIDPANKGVRLVRKFSYTLKDNNQANLQSAIVGVSNAALGDGATLKTVGEWYTPSMNQIHNWGEDVFDIPAEFTEGVSQLKIVFQHTGVGPEWNMFHLWVYSVLPTTGQTEGPGQVSDLDHQMVGLSPCLSWPIPQGVPPTMYHIYRSSSQAFNCDDEAYVGSSGTNEWCEPDPLDAQSTYYYRVAAEDCTGMRGLCTSEPYEVYTGVEPACFEAEDTFDGEHSIPVGTEAYQEVSGSEFSGNMVVIFNSTVPNFDYMPLLYEVEYEATYQIQVTFWKGPDMGIVRVSVNGFPMAADIDLYSEENELITVNIGQRMLSPSTSGVGTSFVFRVTGKNVLSTNYHIAVDNVCLLGID